MNLLAAEITARTGRDPGEYYQVLTAEFGTAYYTRIDAPATPELKSKLERLSSEAVKLPNLAGEPIIAKLTRAPGNGAPIEASRSSPAAAGLPHARRHRGRSQDLRREL